MKVTGLSSLSPAGPLSPGEATGCKARFHRYNPRRSAALVLGSSALTWWRGLSQPRLSGLGLRLPELPPEPARVRPPQAAHLGEWEDAAPRRGGGAGGVLDECGRRGLQEEEPAPEGGYKKRRLRLAAPS